MPDRKSFLKENGICYKCCLSTTHLARDCKRSLRQQKMWMHPILQLSGRAHRMDIHKFIQIFRKSPSTGPDYRFSRKCPGDRLLRIPPSSVSLYPSPIPDSTWYIRLHGSLDPDPVCCSYLAPEPGSSHPSCSQCLWTQRHSL
ncbi:uncharacterized protein ACNLHF_021992 [Anomaloglossus baeobatrachus]